MRRQVDSDIYTILAPLLPCELPPALPLPGQPRTISVARNVSEQRELDAGPITFYAAVNASINGSVFISSGPGAGGQAQVPCRDVRGCPDLVVDASRLLVGSIVDRSFSDDDCSVVEGTVMPGERRLLRFTFTTPNVGDGDLWIGAPENHVEWFHWAECHEHYHFMQHADYRLWAPVDYLEWLSLRQESRDRTSAELLAENPALANRIVTGHKQGFCAIDVQVYAPVEPAKYLSCAENQGISRGWGDEYQFQLDGQWVDVTGLPGGPYVLEAEVNPDRAYREMDYWNNAGAALVILPPPEAPVGPYGLPGGL